MSFKICTVGCGNMAGAMHGPSYKKYVAFHPDTELAACCDLDEERAADFRKKFGFSRHYTCIDKMLDVEKPDAVCLIAPVKLTCELSCRILERGHPLLMEKPPGMTTAETIKMAQAAQQKGTPNQVAFNRRYMPLIGKLKGLLSEKSTAGQLNDIQYRVLRVGRTEADFSTTAVHGIDVVKHLAGSNYKTVRFHYQELDRMGKGAANIHLECEFESGVFARLDFFPVSGVDAERLEANCDNGVFNLNVPIWDGAVDMPGRLTYMEDNKLVYEEDGRSVSESGEGFVYGGFYGENEAFFEDIRNGRKPAGDIASGLQSVDLMDCIRKRIAEYSCRG